MKPSKYYIHKSSIQHLVIIPSIDPINVSDREQLQRFVVFVDIEELTPLYVEEEE
jgi:predicted ATPase